MSKDEEEARWEGHVRWREQQVRGLRGRAVPGGFEGHSEARSCRAWGEEFSSEPNGGAFAGVRVGVTGADPLKPEVAAVSMSVFP